MSDDIVSIIALQYPHAIWGFNSHIFECRIHGEKIRVKRITDSGKAVTHGDWNSCDEFVRHNEVLYQARVISRYDAK